MWARAKASHLGLLWLRQTLQKCIPVAWLLHLLFFFSVRLIPTPPLLWSHINFSPHCLMSAYSFMMELKHLLPCEGGS